MKYQIEIKDGVVEDRLEFEGLTYRRKWSVNDDNILELEIADGLDEQMEEETECEYSEETLKAVYTAVSTDFIQNMLNIAELER